MTDTAKLIAQARGEWSLTDEEVLALADALEAAEAMHQGQRAAKMDALLRVEKAEAERDYWRKVASDALGWIDEATAGLRAALAGSGGEPKPWCTCGAKTMQGEHHKPGCPARVKADEATARAALAGSGE